MLAPDGTVPMATTEPATTDSATTDSATTDSAPTTTAPPTSVPTPTSAPTSVPPSVEVPPVEQAEPRLFFQGLCRTDDPPAFAWGLGNFGDAAVEVDVRVGGVVVGTFALDAGEVTGFTTADGGTAEAVVGGALVATTESSDAPCSVDDAEVGLGGVCYEAGRGYQWLVGNLAAEPIQAEVRLGDEIVGTFALDPGGIEGFTTARGGTAQAFVDGVLVAEAESNDMPCSRPPLAIEAQCFEPGVGYRWVVFPAAENPPRTFEIVIDGASQGTFTLGDDGFADVVTAVGGTAELVVEGEVVDTAESSDVVCNSPIFVSGSCRDPQDRFVWSVFNFGETAITVRLVLNGTELDTVTLAPAEQREILTQEGGTLEAYGGDLLLGETESADGPCVFLGAGCFEEGAGYTWFVGSVRGIPTQVEVRLDGAAVGVFDLEPYESTEFVTAEGGLAQAYVGGALVTEAQSSDDPCPPPELFGLCVDPGRGFVWRVGNFVPFPRRVELRLNGVSLGSYSLAPGESQEVVTATGGTMEVLLDGDVVNTAESNDEPCFGPPPSPPSTARPAVLPATLPTTGGGHPWLALAGAVLLGLGLVLASVSRPLLDQPGETP